MATPAENLPENDHSRAFALWAFLHPRSRLLKLSDAIEIDERLRGLPRKRLDDVAIGLRAEIERRGVSIKHCHLLEAAARYIGFHNLHAASRAGGRDVLSFADLVSGQIHRLRGWNEVGLRVCQARIFKPAVLQLYFGDRHLLLSVATAADRKSGNPIAIVTPLHGGEWLSDAASAFEVVRRHFEEGDIAVVDGLTTLDLCSNRLPSPLETQPITASDVRSSELVLLREDNDLLPGFEIARGDELECWAQLQLALEDGPADASIKADEEDGAWHIGHQRYVWSLAVLHPHDYVPGMIDAQLPPAESARLLRRFRQAQRILGSKIAACGRAKQLEAISGIPTYCRVDLHRLLREMASAGLTWESYCAEVSEAQQMESLLPIGFVFSLIERLGLEDPNVIFAKPTRAELYQVNDDAFLRTLMPRVEHVTYRASRDLPADVRSAIKDAIEELAGSLLVQRMQGAGMIADSGPLPHLVFAADPDELRSKLGEYDVDIYAGVVPRLFRIPDEHRAKAPEVFPFAFGKSLYLDFVPRGG